MSRTKITNAMVKEAYAQAARVYAHSELREDALLKLCDMGMNRASASFMINAYIAMRKGEVYKKTINLFATKYYLENIQKENGQDALRLALRALQAHIKYYEFHRGEKLSSFQNLHDSFEKKLTQRR